LADIGYSHASQQEKIAYASQQKKKLIKKIRENNGK